MTQPHHPAISTTPDYSVSSAKQAQMAPEFVELDRKAGWLVVNKYTYKIMRFLLNRTRPEFDKSGVDIQAADELGPGTIIVSPKHIPSTQGTGKGALILIHGGGMVMGSPGDILAQATRFAVELGIPVICAGYRLAPQAPFPAPLDDCLNVWLAVQDHAEAMGIDAGKVVIAGYSAGAGLAASLAQSLLDQGTAQPAAQLLVYPMLDDRTAANRDLDKPRHRVWSNRNNLFGWTSFLGHAPGGAAPQYAAAARRENLAGLPPTWLGVGTCDLFLDEGRVYAQRLSEAGVDTIYLEADGGIHAFDAAGTDIAKAFVAAQMDFVRKHTI
jgi:acetyl esterase/lipase